MADLHVAGELGDGAEGVQSLLVFGSGGVTGSEERMCVLLLRISIAVTNNIL